MATFHLSSFSAEITPPLGQKQQGGLNTRKSDRIDDPLFAHGLVLLGGSAPIVLAALDYCGVSNDAHDFWRQSLAEAAHTTRDRVIVASLHQHDAPMADLEAHRVAKLAKLPEPLFDLTDHEKALRRTAQAVAASLKNSRQITHVGMGQAKVEKFASNRRILGPDGKVVLVRGSASGTNPLAVSAPEGLIDPWLKTLSFWKGDQPVAALSCYATHPMSYYNRGGISSDTVGLARKRRSADAPKVAQVYFTGCGGNVAAGKYNDGAEANRAVLTERIYQAMKTAWENTKRQPLTKMEWRSLPLQMPVKNTPGFRPADFQALLDNAKAPLGERSRAAFGLSWRKRMDAGKALDVPVLDLGGARWLQLPGEPFVEHQLLAQKLRPDLFVMVIGYGDCGPWYLPTDKAYDEGGYEPGVWSFVGPGTEKAIADVLKVALK